MLKINQLLMEQVVTIAYQAAEKILEFYETEGLYVEQKSDESPLTAADLASHQYITAALEAIDSSIPILSEESAPEDFSERKKWAQYWLVDPLDGTKEFIARNPEFTVNIALIEGNEAVLGVVLVPPTGACYAGGPAMGAWQKKGADEGWQAIQSCAVQDIGSTAQERQLRVLASRHHGRAALTSLLDRLEDRFGELSIQNVGSALKICLCATGEADIYPRLAPTCEWDTAAGQAILKAAGGTIIRADGGRLMYNTKESLKNPHFFALGDVQFDWHSVLIDV